jgi:hypothetical protein
MCGSDCIGFFSSGYDLKHATRYNELLNRILYCHMIEMEKNDGMPAGEI